MNSSLRARFARLGPIRAIDRVPSGSPATLVLRLSPDGATPRTIDATHALARRGLTTLRAKRAIEKLVEEGRLFIDVPTIEDLGTLIGELAGAGIAAAEIESPKPPDVRALRERLGLTREEFARRYGLDVETVRNWEAGRRVPDMAACSYLRVISNAPEPVERAYAPTPAR